MRGERKAYSFYLRGYLYIAFTAAAILFFYRGGQTAQARGKKKAYIWEDRSDGLFSLDATAVAFDPNRSGVIYAGVNGILYRSENAGGRWRPLVSFSGSGRGAVKRVQIEEELRKIKDRILEEKFEDLVAEVGEERAQELLPTLEREAEEEAEDELIRMKRERDSEGGRRRIRRLIYRIVIAGENSEVIAVATDGGLFLSRDRGKTFRHVFRGRAPGEGDVRTVAFAPLNPNQIWIGTSLGLWHSPDGGKRWFRNVGSLRTVAVREIKFHPTDRKKVYVASERSLFFSSDGGKSFTRVWSAVSGNLKITSLTILPTRPKPTIIVGTGNGIFSSKGLKSFKNLPARGLGSRNVLYLTSCPASPKHLYAITDLGFFVSKNRGRTFKELRAGLPSTNIRFAAVNPTDPLDIWVATDFGLYRWTEIKLGKMTPAQWNRFQRRLKREPSPWQVARALLRFMAIPSLDSIYSRLRKRSWLPQVSFSSRLYLNRSDDQFLLKNGITPIKRAESRLFFLELYLQWYPDRWISDPQETRIYQSLRELRRLRERLLMRLMRLYQSRRRLIFRLKVSPPKKFHRYMRYLLKIQELTAYIDAFTGGYFSKRTQFP